MDHATSHVSRLLYATKLVGYRGPYTSLPHNNLNSSRRRRSSGRRHAGNGETRAGRRLYTYYQPIGEIASTLGGRSCHHHHTADCTVASHRLAHGGTRERKEQNRYTANYVITYFRVPTLPPTFTNPLSLFSFDRVDRGTVVDDLRAREKSFLIVYEGNQYRFRNC